MSRWDKAQRRSANPQLNRMSVWMSCRRIFDMDEVCLCLELQSNHPIPCFAFHLTARIPTLELATHWDTQLQAHYTRIQTYAADLYGVAVCCALYGTLRQHRCSYGGITQLMPQYATVVLGMNVDCNPEGRFVAIWKRISL